MSTAYVRNSLIAACGAAALLGASGCGSSGEQKSVAVDADVKAQVENVCRQVAGEFKGLPMPTTQNGAVQVQKQSAQIFQTATGKLRELEADSQLPDEYKNWIEQYAQIAQYNEQAAQAFGKYGVTSEQALEAADKWKSQENKANDLARKAGLDTCVVGQSKSS